jgi:hypothetical protein
MKTAIIRQPAGLGDILYTYKIAKKLIEHKKADIVYWPVCSQYEYLNDYIFDPKIIFVPERHNFPFKEVYLKDEYSILDTSNFLYIPLQRADSIIKPNKTFSNIPMYCKYELVNLSFANWSNYINLRRNYEREKKLESYFTEKNDDFCLINKTYCTFPAVQHISIPKKNKEIEIKNLGFDNIFDWCGLIETCKEFHTVETAFCYIAFLLGANNVFVYPRGNKNNFSYVSEIFPKHWNYVIK